ncbi:galactan 5-O-arabinofuranosyltransferase [Corynebacterium tapiri]
MTNLGDSSAQASPATGSSESVAPLSVGPRRDDVSRVGVLWRMAASTLGGGAFALVCWLVLKMTSLPAFNTSMVTRALATAGTAMVLVITGVLAFLWVRSSRDPGPRPMWLRVITNLVCHLSPAALVVTALAVPLAATRLFLDGIQVDQGFRSQFLTRMATTLANQDMNYVDMPSYYPMGWFWLGGRLANVLNVPGWEVFQPWAIVSIAAAGSLLVAVWQRLTSSLPMATAIALVTVCIVLVTTPDEPYAAVVAMGAPAAVAMARPAMRGSWFATAGIMVFLGISAMFYTLFTGATALAIVLIALVNALVRRSFTPILHLAVIGVGSVLIALISWGPFLFAALSGAYELESTANHFLPSEGTELPLPFLAPSVVGILCFCGLLYLVVRARTDQARNFLVALAAFYLWCIASMLAPLVGTSLLGFRMEVMVTLMFTTLGVIALGRVAHLDLRRFYPQGVSERTGRIVLTVAAVIMVASGVSYAQGIPEHNEDKLDHAYRDTDGHGERGDRYKADAGSSFTGVNEHLLQQGFDPNDTVVLTDETRFLSFFPYHGFNAFTSHYANPLGEFSQRNATIREWAESSWDDNSDPAAFRSALDNAPWRAPDVFVFRGDASDAENGWKTHLAEDIFPNQPNVRYDAVFFNPAVFADESLWNVEQVGPFVVVTSHA